MPQDGQPSAQALARNLRCKDTAHAQFWYVGVRSALEPALELKLAARTRGQLLDVDTTAEGKHIICMFPCTFVQM